MEYPLDMACRRLDVPMVKLLLANGADPNLGQPLVNCQCMMVGATSGTSAPARFPHGSSFYEHWPVAEQSAGFFTAGSPSLPKRLDIVQILLAAGAKVDAIGWVSIEHSDCKLVCSN